jgi:hypothetical protein
MSTVLGGVRLLRKNAQTFRQSRLVRGAFVRKVSRIFQPGSCKPNRLSTWLSARVPASLADRKLDYL